MEWHWRSDFERGGGDCLSTGSSCALFFGHLVDLYILDFFGMGVLKWLPLLMRERAGALYSRLVVELKRF